LQKACDWHVTYFLITRWRVDGIPEEVYDIHDDAADLPRWWPSVYLDVRELPPNPARGPGNVYELFTKGWLPYTMRWRLRRTAQDPPHGYAIEAWGDFVGRGEWTFTADGPHTDVTYDWRVRTEKPMVRSLSFLLKPVFAANHSWMMARGEGSLKLKLARRRACTPEERAAVSSPPGPTWAAGRHKR
jgi:hypothetical protein